MSGFPHPIFEPRQRLDYRGRMRGVRSRCPELHETVK